jgi:hypothetical protein
MEEGQLGEKALLECQRKSKGYDGFMTAAERTRHPRELRSPLVSR